MTRACVITVVPEPDSDLRDGAEAYVARIARRHGIRAQAALDGLGEVLDRDDAIVLSLFSRWPQAPAPERVVEVVRELLGASDVVAVRVRWLHVGARRGGRVDVGDLSALENAPWDRTFVLEVRRSTEPPEARSLRRIAFGIVPEM
jgi:hypothetical protein